MLAGMLDDGDAVMNKSDVVLFSISLQSKWGDRQLQYTAFKAMYDGRGTGSYGNTGVRASDQSRRGHRGFLEEVTSKMWPTMGVKSSLLLAFVQPVN